MPLSARVLPILPSAAQMAVSCCATANLKDWLSNQGNASVLGIRISSERNVLLSVSIELRWHDHTSSCCSKH